MTFIKRLALAGITAAAALVCSNAAQAQQECVDSFVVAGSNATGPCWTDGTGYFDISWTGGCLATNRASPNWARVKPTVGSSESSLPNWRQPSW